MLYNDNDELYERTTTYKDGCVELIQWAMVPRNLLYQCNLAARNIRTNKLGWHSTSPQGWIYLDTPPAIEIEFQTKIIKSYEFIKMF